MFNTTTQTVTEVYAPYQNEKFLNQRTLVGYIIDNNYVPLPGCMQAVDALGRMLVRQRNLPQRISHLPRETNEKHTFVYIRTTDYWGYRTVPVACIVKDNETGEFGVSIVNPTPYVQTTSSGKSVVKGDQFVKKIARENAIANIGKKIQINNRLIGTEGYKEIPLNVMVKAVIEDWEYL